MKRREFIALIVGAAAARPLAGSAQPERMRRVGVLMNGGATEKTPQSNLAAFVEALNQLGWIERRNLRIDVRWNVGDAQLARIYAAQLIGLIPDVIFTASTTNLAILQQATITIPVVFTQVSDPVAQGFVASMSKPGGNLTGFSQYEFSIGAKWLQLLKEIVPDISRVGVLFNPDTSPQSKFFMRSIQSAAPSLGVQTTALPIRATADIEPALEAFAQQPRGGLLIPTGAYSSARQALIIDQATRHRLPIISSDKTLPQNGGLMSYGLTGDNLREMFRQAAGYVDRILKGEKPTDLPVQAPIKFELVINLKTAKALGLDVPPMLLARADEVIE